MAWSNDLAPRGKASVNLACTVRRSEAEKLDQIGDVLFVRNSIKKNTSYQVLQYAVRLLILSMEEELRGS